jgi:hypothetical protein
VLGNEVKGQNMHIQNVLLLHQEMCFFGSTENTNIMRAPETQKRMFLNDQKFIKEEYICYYVITCIKETLLEEVQA